MPVKRLPSPESALAELTAQLAERGGMSLDDAYELLREPAPPISETLRSMGLSGPDTLVAHLTADQRAHLHEDRISELATKYQLSDSTTDDRETLIRELNGLHRADEPGHFEFSERITLGSVIPAWTEAVHLDLIGNEFTVAAWSRERFEMTMRQRAALPTRLTEIVFYTYDPHTFVHPLWGTNDGDNRDLYDRWLEALADGDLDEEGDGIGDWPAADAS